MPNERFIDLWRSEELRGISVDRDVLRIGALTTYTEIIASKMVQKRVPMLVAAVARSRRRADSESRHARRQRRQCLAGRATRCRCWPPRTRGSSCAARAATRTVPFDTFYTGYRTSVRQPDELIVGDRDSAHRRRAVVAQGRHPARAGDLEDHDGRACAAATCASRSDRSRRRWCSRQDAAAVLSRRRHRSPTRRRRCAQEIAPIDDVRSTGEYRATGCRRTCSQSSGRRRHEGCAGARVLGCWGAGACAVCAPRARRTTLRDARDGRRARGDGAGVAVSRHR